MALKGHLIFSALRIYAISGGNTRSSCGVWSGTRARWHQHRGGRRECVSDCTCSQDAGHCQYALVGSPITCSAGNTDCGQNSHIYNVQTARISMTTILVLCLSGVLAVLSDIIVIAVKWPRTKPFGKPTRSNYPTIITLMFRNGMFLTAADVCEHILLQHIAHPAGTLYFK
ncbi:hypothetical protein C8Q72DRAFT_835079 [Fomitopsis betulina]|nr:hypothetical protein C8Q72DRAFT_835079 [Fomitopsis betulina]